MHRLILIIGAALALASPAMAQTVTATKLVGTSKGKELLRKINGRWWTQDNREVNPPGKGGFFWIIDSKPGVVEFYHHRPFDLSKAESLHLFMTSSEVEAALGPPNRIFRMGPNGGMWSYYAANGTIVEVRIMEGGLGEAEYRPVGGKATSVASMERELNGRSIFKLMAERAGQRSNAPPSAPPVRTPIPEAAPLPPPEKHIVSGEALAKVKIGASRAEVLAALGEPSARYSMSSDTLRETFRYHRPDGQPLEIKLVDGKVTSVP